ncbi:MAG: hypothetical protein AAF487_05055 [Bacteroidota bacterium]
MNNQKSNSIYIPFVLAIFAFTSCTKNIDVSPEGMAGYAADKSTIVEVYSIDIEQITPDQKTIIGGFKSANHNEVVISTHPEEALATIVLQNNGHILNPENVKCTGSSKTILQCVQNWLIENPGQCLRITEKNAEYWASNDCTE